MTACSFPSGRLRAAPSRAGAICRPTTRRPISPAGSSDDMTKLPPEMRKELAQLGLI